MTLCQRLAELGVYHSDGPGRPRLYGSYEEALVAKRHLARRAQAERRARVRDARQNGEPTCSLLHTWKREEEEEEEEEEEF